MATTTHSLCLLGHNLEIVCQNFQWYFTIGANFVRTNFAFPNFACTNPRPPVAQNRAMKACCLWHSRGKHC